MPEHIDRQIAVLADIRTEGKTYCSIRCPHCKQNRVSSGLRHGSPTHTHWVYNYCTLFNETLRGHNKDWYPKRRPKCVRYSLHAEVLSSLYRAAKDILPISELAHFAKEIQAVSEGITNAALGAAVRARIAKDSVHKHWDGELDTLGEAVNQASIWEKQLKRHKPKGV